ncbi:MAG: FMN-binding protein, partial [Oscillibacter sp.]|nr:FMN-binding protein [Oscillibacter sp.]
MAEQISRRTFVKGLAAGAASIAALGVLERLSASKSGGESATAAEVEAETTSAAPEVTNALVESANIDIKEAGLTFTPGTYTASATGLGLVTMTATFDETSVTDIVLDVSNETEDIGQAAANTLIQQCLEKQGTDIDGVTGATLTTNAVKRCLRSCILQAAGMEEDGASTASAASDDAWLGEAPDITDDMVEETVTADVLVIGCGVAGVAAVRAAAEEGANVVAVEKGSGPQCRSG